MPKSLTNFNVPISVRQRFDEVCRASGRTRTSVLVELMENFVLLQGKVLEERAKRLEQVDHSIRESRRIMGFREFLGEQSAKDRKGVQSGSKSDFDLPDPMMSDGQEDW